MSYYVNVREAHALEAGLIVGAMIPTRTCVACTTFMATEGMSPDRKVSKTTTKLVFSLVQLKAVSFTSGGRSAAKANWARVNVSITG